MGKRISGLVAFTVLIIGALVLAAPSTSHAVIISNFCVTVGGFTYKDVTNGGGTCGAGASSTNWNLQGGGGAGINLGTSGTLVLAQNAPAPFATGTNPALFNFDSSERNGTGQCTPAGTCATTGLTVNGILLAINAGASGNNSPLANFNADPGGTAHNEAANYVLAASTATFDVFFGYADNAHTDACSSSGHNPENNCIPNGGPFTTATFFLGSAVGTAATGCASGVAPCFDSGVVLIVAHDRIPEPSTLFLIGTGLLGLSAWGRSRTKRIS